MRSPTERNACYLTGYIRALQAVHLFKTKDAACYWLAVISRTERMPDVSRRLIAEMDNPPASAEDAIEPRRANMSANTTALSLEQREAIYKAWVAALRSGQYKQGRLRLESDGKFDCMGVLCHVLHQRPELGVKMRRFEGPDGVAYLTDYARGSASVPFSHETHELGLSVEMPGGHRSVETVLTALNDTGGASFAEIAQYIEGVVMPLLRAKGVLPPARQEAPEGTALERADSHSRICSKLAEQHKSDPVLFAAFTDSAAIICDLLRELRRETERRWEGNRRAAQEYVEDMRCLLKEAAQICKDLDDEALAKEDRLACGAECAAAIEDLAARMNIPFEEHEHGHQP